MFYPKITKTGGIKNIDHHAVKTRNYTTSYYQTVQEVPGTLVLEKIQKHEKIANIF